MTRGPLLHAPRRLAAPFLALTLLGAGAFGPAPEGLRMRDVDGRWTPLQRNPCRGTESVAPDGRNDSRTALLDRIRWTDATPGVEWGIVELSAGGVGGVVDLIVARISPESVRLALVWDRDAATGRPIWGLDRTPADALLSVNAGMFLDTVPWGWVRLDGVDRLAPGRGPLSSALAVDTSGHPHWVDGDDLSALRARGDIALAFQSYPTLLTGDGAIPAALLGGNLIDRHHRDIRLALGLDRRGRLLVALTRSGLPLPGADRLPLGLTVPEMARVMSALDARQAMLLDGGLSAQMLVRGPDGATCRWAGLRKVPLALVVRGRADVADASAGS